MYKDTQETSSRKTLILALVVILHACGLLFIAHVNNWFPLKEHVVDNEKEKTVNNEIKTKEMETDMNAKNDVDEQTLTVNKIYLPEQIPFQDQDAENPNNVNNNESETPIKDEQDSHFSKHPLPVENKDTKLANHEEPEIPNEIKPDNVIQEDIEKYALEQAALPEKRVSTDEVTGTENDFDFTEYTTSLVKNYGKREGEKIPLLLIDDHNESRLYKKGLGFYGYRLIARPRIRLKEPYYFVINDSVIQLLQETCPYTGAFPSVLQEDRKLFEVLLQQPQYKELSKNQHQIFYAPIDTQMLSVVESKQKLILENMDLDIKQVSRMIGTFKKVGSSYILIIESIGTIDGTIIKVHDPDNSIMTASLY